MELKCKMCGEPLYPEDGQTVVMCDFCGSEQTVPVAQDPHKIAMFNEANNYRMQNRFDLASNLYQHIVEEYPDEKEADWCLVLCRYGIEYVDDPKDGTIDYYKVEAVDELDETTYIPGYFNGLPVKVVEKLYKNDNNFEFFYSFYHE